MTYQKIIFFQNPASINKLGCGKSEHNFYNNRTAHSLTIFYGQVSFHYRIRFTWNSRSRQNVHSPSFA